MEQLMAEMAPHLDENSDGPEDPRQMAALMKKDVRRDRNAAERCDDGSHASFGSGRKIPDKIDEEMGDALDGDGDPFSPENKVETLEENVRCPDVDPELYELDGTRDVRHCGNRTKRILRLDKSCR